MKVVAKILLCISVSYSFLIYSGAARSDARGIHNWLQDEYEEESIPNVTIAKKKQKKTKRHTHIQDIKTARESSECIICNPDSAKKALICSYCKKNLWYVSWNNGHLNK